MINSLLQIDRTNLNCVYLFKSLSFSFPISPVNKVYLLMRCTLKHFYVRDSVPIEALELYLQSCGVIWLCSGYHLMSMQPNRLSRTTSFWNTSMTHAKQRLMGSIQDFLQYLHQVFMTKRGATSTWIILVRRPRQTVEFDHLSVLEISEQGNLFCYSEN